MMEKHPDDRFATAEELVNELEGGPGSLPITAVSPIPTSRQSALPETVRAPALEIRKTMPRTSVMTPTTPVPRITVPAKVVKPPRRPLRIAAALTGVMFLTVGGSLGGGYLYLENGGEVPAAVRRYEPALRDRAPWLADRLPLDRWLATPSPADTTPADGVVPPPVDSTADTLITMPADSSVGPDSTVAPDSLGEDADSTSAGGTDTTAIPVLAEEPPPAAPTTGVLVVTNLGSRATLWIDGTNVRGVRHELPAGVHEVRAAAPGYERYAGEVTVIAGDTVQHRVSLRQVSQCERFGPTYNQNGECFDKRAHLDPRASTLITIDGTVPRQPTTPVELLIEVGPDGTAANIVVRSPSDVPEFALLAVKYAQGLTYEPATKSGRPVTAWTTAAFYAQP